VVVGTIALDYVAVDIDKSAKNRVNDGNISSSGMALSFLYQIYGLVKIV